MRVFFFVQLYDLSHFTARLGLAAGTQLLWTKKPTR
jgi:hypothetical protein